MKSLSYQTTTRQPKGRIHPMNYYETPTITEIRPVTVRGDNGEEGGSLPFDPDEEKED